MFDCFVAKMTRGQLELFHGAVSLIAWYSSGGGARSDVMETGPLTWMLRVIVLFIVPQRALVL